MSIQTIVLGGGCFWCLEAVFQNIVGVKSVISGYAGGESENPDYESVCSGLTGHAEVVGISFENTEISFQELLHIFFTIHDPTTLNRQGNDVGTQYRSVIFYKSDEEKDRAMKVTHALNKAGIFDNKIVTTFEELTTFYKAEDYHQDYFNKNPGNPYCQYSIPPKKAKIIEKFSQYLKPDA